MGGYKRERGIKSVSFTTTAVAVAACSSIYHTLFAAVLLIHSLTLMCFQGPARYPKDSKILSKASICHTRPDHIFGSDAVLKKGQTFERTLCKIWHPYPTPKHAALPVALAQTNLPCSCVAVVLASTLDRCCWRTRDCCFHRADLNG